ncbi:hypothetical protein Moror_5653 [Moniliophthora roreri MCA 2997]|uniref:Uncharacterized protein n=1 Tax=Moniliophthora roreri (strain MCA 2997) TaxID=1381753 RepID=V2WQF7_MONRO|nr:hypothetical protein Moror_5653 [Moniliophthora roreri MCA 2997]
MPSPSPLSATVVYFAPISLNFTLANRHARSINELATVASCELPPAPSSRPVNAADSILQAPTQSNPISVALIVSFLAGIFIFGVFWLELGIMASSRNQASGSGKVQPLEEQLFNLPARDLSENVVAVPIYKLKTTLKKHELQEELVKFSNSPELWALFRPGAQRPHKGLHSPKPGSQKAKKVKGYLKCQQEMFPGNLTRVHIGTTSSDYNPDILALADKLPQLCPSYYKPRPLKKEPEQNATVANEQILQGLGTVQKTVNLIASCIVAANPNALASIQAQAPADVTPDPNILRTAHSMTQLPPPPPSTVYSLLPLLPSMDVDVDIGLPGLLRSSPPQTIPFLPIPAPTPLEVPNNAVSNTMPPAVSTNPSAPTFMKTQTKKLQLAHDWVLIYM